MTRTPGTPATASASTGTAARRGIVVRGVVQGVGFRPHVARVAASLGLRGWCRNDVTGVFIEVEGPAEVVAEFERRLADEAPPMSRVDSVASEPLPAGDSSDTGGDKGFRIIASDSTVGERTLVPPDTAVCDDCLAELRDPTDRRYRHPFITCTNCGPRLSITVDLPYDRPNTTLAGFPFCEACAREYADPLDRRYHAQPIGCHECGPTLWFTPGSLGVATDGMPRREEALAAAVEVLASGGVLAVKGIGGYHLACDATDPAAVARLRERKQRPDRPFALLVADLAAASDVAEVEPDPTREPAALLHSPRRPIVLLPRRTDSRVAHNVAPGLDELGVMLAYAPVHHLLSADLAARTGDPPVLVMTSGNSSGEPLCHRDDDAISRLGPLADGILGHDRPIVVPVEDSVIAWSDTVGEVPIRRSRGYAPLPLDLATASGEASATSLETDGQSAPDPERVSNSRQPEQPTVLAAGAELKNTVALTSAGRVFVSAHIGDLESMESQAAHRAASDQLLRFHRVKPQVVVADMHPGYASRAWARSYADEFGVPLIEVQHHHAHLAALAAEQGMLDEPLLGLVFDGTGYGCDSTVWGGELLLLRDGGLVADRLGHLGRLRLPGGDGGVRNPARTAALALLDHGIDLDGTRVGDELGSRERTFVQRAHETGVATVETSSVGRLFDIAASVLGLRHRVTYEAQAAVELEAAARRWLRSHKRQARAHSNTPDPASATGTSAGPSAHDLRERPAILDPAPLLRHLVTETQQGREQGELAAWFHVKLGHRAAALAAEAAAATGVRSVALTGGVFVNRLLLAATAEALRAHALTPVTHRVVPANDGGLALGQAAVALRAPYKPRPEAIPPAVPSKTIPTPSEPAATEPAGLPTRMR